MGFDPIDTPPPPTTFAVAAAAKKHPALKTFEGAYWKTKIGKLMVVIVKSDSPMSQDSPQLPNRHVWKQIIEDVRPKLVITTGTAGGIGAQFEVGDVVVSPVVRFDCTSKFKNESFHDADFSSSPANFKKFAKSEGAFEGKRGTATT
jgi:hypothetical protein